MTDPTPAPHDSPWLRVGALASDCTGRCGVVQLLQDDLGGLRGDVIEHPTRALLRPVHTGEIHEQPWWAAVGDLEPVIE